MFEKKKCPSCGEKVKDEWEFCPICGEALKERREVKLFDIFDDIEKEFERIDKMFGFEFPRFRIRPGIKGGGISITIHSVSGKEPKIEVKTTGEYKKLEPEIKRRLGVKPAVEEVESVEEEAEKKKFKVPKVTEEPETKIEKVGNKQLIKIKLPSVKEEDIEVKKLEQSIEVKAFAGDKAYFKLIPIPTNASVTRKEFKNEILTIEVER
ncbi:MAG: zinc ribbon domain-containing protein [Candidatus Aenigmarchaeota archaeon]|nr:zinc ribbon domain-containing protein [Candidatus Aenigmarchaeota archaeon]